MVGIYSNVCSHSNWQDNRKIFDVRSLLKSIGTSILILTKPFCYWLLSCHWLWGLSHLDTQLGIWRTLTWSRQTIAITIGSPHGITCSGASYAMRKQWKKPSKSSRGYVTSINWSAISTVRRFFLHQCGNSSAFSIYGWQAKLGHQHHQQQPYTPLMKSSRKSTPPMKSSLKSTPAMRSSLKSTATKAME